MVLAGWSESIHDDAFSDCHQRHNHRPHEAAVPGLRCELGTNWSRVGYLANPRGSGLPDCPPNEASRPRQTETVPRAEHLYIMTKRKSSELAVRFAPGFATAYASTSTRWNSSSMHAVCAAPSCAKNSSRSNSSPPLWLFVSHSWRTTRRFVPQSKTKRQTSSSFGVGPLALRKN